MTTSWVVLNAGTWRSLTLVRQLEMRAWLDMNNIEPIDIPAESTVRLAENGEGNWEIQFDQFVRGADGRIKINPDKPDEGYVRERSAPLQIDPPMHWLTEDA